MADRRNDDRIFCLVPLFNGTMTGPSKKGDDGDSYAVWRARPIINLRANRLLSIVIGNDDDEDSDDVLCAAKNETSVEFMGRMFWCNFLRKSRL
jgi:hypothetical protein